MGEPDPFELAIIYIGYLVALPLMFTLLVLLMPIWAASMFMKWLTGGCDV